MAALSERERQLLDRLAAEGKPTRLLDEEPALVRQLEADGLVFLVGLRAIVTPKGRRLLAKDAKKPKRDTPAFKLT